MSGFSHSRVAASPASRVVDHRFARGEIRQLVAIERVAAKPRVAARSVTNSETMSFLMIVAFRQPSPKTSFRLPSASSNGSPRNRRAARTIPGQVGEQPSAHPAHWCSHRLAGRHRPGRLISDPHRADVPRPDVGRGARLRARVHFVRARHGDQRVAPPHIVVPPGTDARTRRGWSSVAPTVRC
jgi:hypothetical protein